MSRFRIIRRLPGVVEFRGGQRVILEARPAVSAWTMFARKDLPPGHWQAGALWSAYDEAQLEQAGREGVEVETGSSAERVMLALVRLGVAQLLG